jgi:hypothetical protein
MTSLIPESQYFMFSPMRREKNRKVNGVESARRNFEPRSRVDHERAKVWNWGGISSAIIDGYDIINYKRRLMDLDLSQPMLVVYPRCRLKKFSLSMTHPPSTPRLPPAFSKNLAHLCWLFKPHSTRTCGMRCTLGASIPGKQSLCSIRLSIRNLKVFSTALYWFWTNSKVS